MGKYWGAIADNGARGFESWSESAQNHNLKIVSYLPNLDAVVLFGELEDLERFADEETYAWDSADVKDYAFDTIEDAKYDIEMFVIHEVTEHIELHWEDCTDVIAEIEVDDARAFYSDIQASFMENSDIGKVQNIVVDQEVIKVYYESDVIETYRKTKYNLDTINECHLNHLIRNEEEEK